MDTLSNRESPESTISRSETIKVDGGGVLRLRRRRQCQFKRYNKFPPRLGNTLTPRPSRTSGCCSSRGGVLRGRTDDVGDQKHSLLASLAARQRRRQRRRQLQEYVYMHLDIVFFLCLGLWAISHMMMPPPPPPLPPRSHLSLARP